MVPNKLENGAQCCFNKSDCRLFVSKFLSLHFTCLLFTLSFQKVLPSISQSGGIAPLGANLMIRGEKNQRGR